jgi:hypothetical protein
MTITSNLQTPGGHAERLKPRSIEIPFSQDVPLHKLLDDRLECELPTGPPPYLHQSCPAVSDLGDDGPHGDEVLLRVLPVSSSS